MLIVDKLKGNLYTRIKKHMTKKMYHLYYRENREASQSKEEYEANLLRAYRHLDACRFKNKGWPCPTCPSCCFCGKDYETMTEVMDFVRDIDAGRNRGEDRHKVRCHAADAGHDLRHGGARSVIWLIRSTLKVQQIQPFVSGTRFVSF